MTHEVEIKYRITSQERDRLMKLFEVGYPATGERDLREPKTGPLAELRSFLSDQDLFSAAAVPAAGGADAGAVFLETNTYAVYDRYFFDYRHLLFRLRLMVDAARGDARGEITHKQADHKVGEAVNRMEINLPISNMGVKDGDFESVLKLMELMNFRPVLVMKKERIYLKVRLGAAAPMQSLLLTIDRVFGAAPDSAEFERAPARENERTWVPIGDFVEVEAMVSEGRNVDFAGRVVAQWAERLDAEKTWRKEKEGYFALAAQKLGGVS